MRWFRRAARKQPVSADCVPYFFGKVPTQHEFVQSDEQGSLWAAFRAYVERAIECGRWRGEGLSESQLGIRGFFQQDLRDHKALLALIAYSSDASGRRYPLLIGFEIAIPVEIAHPHSVPMLLKPYYQALVQQITALKAGGEIDASTMNIALNWDELSQIESLLSPMECAQATCTSDDVSSNLIKHAQFIACASVSENTWAGLAFALQFHHDRLSSFDWDRVSWRIDSPSAIFFSREQWPDSTEIPRMRTPAKSVAAHMRVIDLLRESEQCFV